MDSKPPKMAPEEAPRTKITAQHLLVAFEEVRDALKAERTLRSRAESDAAVLAHAYENDHRPPQAVVDRAKQYRPRGK